MTPELSIIIPTVRYHDNEEKIYRILRCVGDQDISANIEVVIVDNGPKYAEGRTAGLPKFAKIVHELTLGLSRARNAGIKASSANLIAFLDDDVIPGKTWLRGIISAHKSPNALCVGGPVVLADKGLVKASKWLSDYFLRFIAPPRFPESAGIVVAPYYIIGANMSFKRKVFDEFGLFDVRLGRRGDCLLSGEDMEFMMRIDPSRIFFDPLANASTTLGPERATRRYFVKRIFWQAISDAYILRKRGFSAYYDSSELYLSKSFFNGLLMAISDMNFFEVFCMIIRISIFKLALICV